MRQGVKTLQVRASTFSEVKPIRGKYREDHEADGPNLEGRSKGLPFFVVLWPMIDWHSRETLGSMIAKRLLIADIFAEQLERLVSAMLFHLEQIGPLPPRLGQEARP